MAQALHVLEELKKNKVTHVIGLPDNSSVKLFELLKSDHDIQLVPVTREGEAFAVAAGLWIGGRVPVVLIQNTLVCLITYRGFAKMTRWRSDEPGAEPNAETLSRAQLDSAALITENTLAAWGLPFDFLHADVDIPKISDAFSRAEKSEWPFALLVTCDLA